MKKTRITLNIIFSFIAIFFINTRCGQEKNFHKISLITALLGKSGGGHSAVMRSLITGFNKKKINFNLNPKKIEEVGDVVMVLSNIEALKQAIQWKKNNQIKLLLAGPNLTTVVEKNIQVLSSPEIDICIVPSYWAQVAYEEEVPSLNGRIKCWFAGVDPLSWVPGLDNKNNKNSLVYWKTEPESLCIEVENTLRKYGWISKRVRYGSYSKQYYKDVLSQSSIAVFLSRSESQGIALAESWAMNIPTLVWNPKERVCCGRQYSLVSSCPYLSDKTGYGWKNIDELESLLENISYHLGEFNPRKWVLENMSDECSAQCLLDIINEKLLTL